MILELCKGVHCVDLGESFQTHIYLQNLASIPPISRSVSNITIVTHLFVPLRYLQFLKLVRFTAAAAENEPCKVCPLFAYRSPRCRLRRWSHGSSSSWRRRTNRSWTRFARCGRTSRSRQRRSRARCAAIIRRLPTNRPLRRASSCRLARSAAGAFG